MKLSRFFVAAVVAASLLVASAAVAQKTAPAKPGTSRAKIAKPGAFKEKGRMWGMLNQLNLTPSQRQQIEGIFKSTQVQAKAIRNNPNLTPAQKQQQLKVLHEGMRNRIEAVLTPEQRAKLAEMMKNRHKAGIKAPNGGGKTAPPPAKPGGGGSGI